jgi:hypothetical protein
MYAIMGITGRVGGAIAENLLAQGEQIRAIVRNPEKAARWSDRGAEIAVADVDDPNALASAFEGTDGVFLMVHRTLPRLPVFRKYARLWRPIMQLSQRPCRRKRYTFPRSEPNRPAGTDKRMNFSIKPFAKRICRATAKSEVATRCLVPAFDGLDRG